MSNFNSLDTEVFPLINEIPEEKYSIEARVEVKNAKFSFGSTNILKDINLALYAGEIYGLLGANGAGKTTLMKAISGRLQLDAGSCWGGLVETDAKGVNYTNRTLVVNGRSGARGYLYLQSDPEDLTVGWLVRD